MRSLVRNYGPATLIVIGVIAGWEVWVRVRGVPDYVLPAPSQIWRAAMDAPGSLISDTAVTAAEALVGIVVGLVAGVALAVAMSLSTTLMRAISPLIVVSQTVPIIVIAPLLVLWFGFGWLPKVIVVALMTFFPVAISTLDGLTSVEPQRVELLRSMGAGRYQMMRYLQFPHAVPSMIEGLRVSAAYAVGGAVVGEWTGASRGLGLYIARSKDAYRIDHVFVGVAIVAILSFVLYLAVDGFGRVSAPWYYRRRRSLRLHEPTVTRPSAIPAMTGAPS